MALDKDGKWTDEGIKTLSIQENCVTCGMKDIQIVAVLEIESVKKNLYF